MSSSEAARRVLEAAVVAGTFPAAAAEAGSSAGPLWQDALGTLPLDPPVPAEIGTPYDLASLTKALATTTVVMQLTATGQLRLDDHVAAFFGDWRGADRAPVTIRELLEHASGLPARLVDVPPGSRREFEHDICDIPLEYPPRTRSIYSDLGFILLGFVAERRGHATLAQQFADIGVGQLTFNLDADTRKRTAPTLPMDDDVRRGRMLIGEVHDNYAAALGGAAGHAGLFGTAPAVGAVQSSTGPAVHHQERRAGQFSRAGVGYDAAVFVVRHPDVCIGVRPRRLHRDVTLDRSRAGSIFRAAHQSRVRRRHARRDAHGPPGLS
jgi:serine-type D-Ala-D-Ala carboxypeptidase